MLMTAAYIKADKLLTYPFALVFLETKHNTILTKQVNSKLDRLALSHYSCQTISGQLLFVGGTPVYNLQMLL